MEQLYMKASLEPGDGNKKFLYNRINYLWLPKKSRFTPNPEFENNLKGKVVVLTGQSPSSPIFVEKRLLTPL